MQPMTLSELTRILRGRQHGADVSFTGVTTDSRNVRAGQLFVALSGPNFDGHDFVDAAAEAGAAAAVVSRSSDWGLPYCEVGDTRIALGDLARAVRHRSPARLVGVTGSNGKTTVKEMIAAILSRVGPTLATQGNLNNDIGVPLTLLRLTPEHRFGVIEMGANHLGEIDYLARIAEPEVGVVTNAGAAHLEGFGGPDGVARGKGELFAALAATSVAVINADDKYAPLWRELAGQRQVIDFGMDAPAAVRGRLLGAGRFVLAAGTEEVEVALSLPGRHNVMNALAAASAALALGVSLPDVVAGLGGMVPVHGRLNWKPGVAGAQVLDDTYNANPTSLRAALAVLAERQEERWLVLGDMAELGAGAESLHAQAASWAKEAGVSRLYAVGRMAAVAASGFGSGGCHYSDKQSLVSALRAELKPGVAVLVKGSRSMAMEQVVAGICEPLEDKR